MTNHYTDVCEATIESLRQQLADMTKERDKAKAMPMKYRRMEFNAQLQDENEALRQQLAAAQDDASTAWAQAHRLAIELECLIMDTKDNAVVSKWWDSAFEALCDYQGLKPGANEEAEAWAAMRKAGI